MFRLKRIIVGSIFVFALTGSALAQGNQLALDKPREPLPAASLVTATTTPKDSSQPLASAAGTRNHLAKFTDNAGTLGDSTFFEEGGNVYNFIGSRLTAGGQPFFDVQRSSNGEILQRFWNTGTGGVTLRYVAGTGSTSQLQLTDNAEWLWLQRSQMFIEPVVSYDLRSSGAQCCLQWYQFQAPVSLRWSEEDLLEFACSINITSVRDEGPRLENLAKKKKTRR